MATIVPTTVNGASAAVVAVTTLTGSDPFVFNNAKTNLMVLHNPTGAPIQPTLIGDAATTRPCAGVGNIDVSAGLQLASIAAGATASINLNNIVGYLSGNLTVESGTGLEAQLLQL